MKIRDVAFVAGASLLLVASLVFVLSRLGDSRARVEFSRDLDRIDRSLQRDGKRVPSLLMGASRHARSASHWLSLLERAYRYGESGGSRDVGLRLSANAVKRFPGNQAIVALHLHLTMRSGEAADLGKIAERLTDERFASLKGEAYLRSGLLWDAGTDGPGLLTEVAESENPGDYFAAQALTGEPRFRIDGVLLLLEDGDIARALTELQRLPVDAAPVLGALVAYDAGDWETFLEYYAAVAASGTIVPEIQMVYADALLARRNRREAIAVYSEILSAPDTAVAHSNLAVLLQAENPRRSIHVLKQGVERFPRDPRVLATHVRVLAEMGELEPAREASAAYGDRLPEDGTLAALTVELTRSPTDPVNRVVSRLWRLHERVTDPEPLARLLAWYLFGLRDREAVREIVGEQRYRSREWSRTYRAAYRAEAGRTRAALELLPEDDLEGWRSRFNRGLLLAVLGTHREAVASFETALRDARADCPDCYDDIARIEYRLALSLHRLGHEERAVGHVLEALKLDPTHTDAKQLLALLES
jgi:tetratricopeptide (TPR) repeat protein